MKGTTMAVLVFFTCSPAYIETTGNEHLNWFYEMAGLAFIADKTC